ncbi:hypothetical protein [Amycolatopsis magusensis]|uniref:hypothetical protein n=1 Tax=Amycolatopsis magusensis TaxID=882444 RepID=UPI0037B0E497
MSTPAAEALESALDFGGIVLPPGAEVLGVLDQRGIDQLYALAVALGPDTVDGLLRASGFGAELEPGRQVFLPPVPGFDPDRGTDIASAQDALPAGRLRPARVTREVLVDRGEPARPVAHLWFYTT